MLYYPELLATCAAVFGAIVGSFLNAVVFRTVLQIREDIAREEADAERAAAGDATAGTAAPEPSGTWGGWLAHNFGLQLRTHHTLGVRSVCPHCREPIPWYFNLPVVGWLILRGRAACCGKPISVGYPLVEAGVAVLFAVLAFGITGSARLGDGSAWILLALHMFFVANLVANGLIDLQTKYLSTPLMHWLVVVGLLGGALIGPEFAGGLPASWTGDLASALDAALPPAAASASASALVGFGAAAAGALCGWCVTFAIRAFGSALFAQEAMGSGDVKLMAGIGAFLGWPGALLTFFLGSLSGAVAGVGGRFVGLDTHTIAFGPYLALGALMVLFGGTPLMHFATVTVPEWQARFAADPRVAVGVIIVCSALLCWVVWKGRSRGFEES